MESKGGMSQLMHLSLSCSPSGKEMGDGFQEERDTQWDENGNRGDRDPCSLGNRNQGRGLRFGLSSILWRSSRGQTTPCRRGRSQCSGQERQNRLDVCHPDEPPGGERI